MANDEWSGLMTTPDNFATRASNLLIQGRMFFAYIDQFAEYFPENNTLSAFVLAPCTK